MLNSKLLLFALKLIHFTKLRLTYLATKFLEQGISNPEEKLEAKEVYEVLGVFNTSL